MVFRPRLLRSFAFPLTVLAVGLASTALLALQLKRTADSRDTERFETAVDRLHDSVRERIDLYVAMLRAGAGLMAAADVESPSQFRAFAERLQLQQRYPGVQGIGYTARIAPSELARVTARHGEHHEGFQVWPGQPRNEYHAILYLEPMDRRNRAAIGYDMFTESTRRLAMERARDSGEPAASGLVTLVQEIDEHKQPGFLIYMPIYRSGVVPAALDARRALLEGFIYSPFRTADLFEGILGSNPRPRAGFDLFDGLPADGNLLYRTSVHERSGRFTTTRSLDVAGRRWTAVAFSTPALDRGSSVRLLPFVLWGGAGTTLVLTGLAALQTRARRRAEASESAAEEASQKFQQLANSIPQLAWMAAPDGRVYWYNDRWYEYTGRSPEETLGSGWQQVHHPDHLGKVLDAWERCLAGGEPFEMEFPLRGADRQFRLFLTRVLPFRDGSGRVMHWFGTSTDVQYRHDAARSLEEQAETLGIVNRSGAQLAGELNLDRLVQAVTDAGTRLTRAQFGAFFYNVLDDRGESYMLYTLSGVPREAFAGFPMPRNTAVFGPTFRGDGIVRSDDITADSRYGQNAPFRGMPPGHLPVRSYLAVPVKSRSGAVLGALFFGHAERAVFTAQSEDIVRGIAAQAAIALDNARLYGEVQRLLESERAARAEAERVSRLKDEFLATLSHELRTPLNAVVGWAHMLSSRALSPEKARHAVDTILRNARMQSQLVDELLDMSRIISGRVSLNLTIVDVREVVDAAVNVVAPTAAAKGIELLVEGAAGAFLVNGDASRLQQVAWNLLSNAIKFTPPGGRVTVSLARRASEVEIRVADTGAGIDPEFLPHVFERFRQGDGSSTRGHGGLGLGLSIAESLVEMHAGSVRARSEGAGKGATFTVVLPLARGEAGLRPPDDAMQGAATASDSDALQHRSVLVVEDDRDAAELVGEILRERGAIVCVAASGREALRMLETRAAPVDLIISDLAMPQMDGYELIRCVRALPPRASGTAPAIALTAYAGAEDGRRATALGYDVHLAKPFPPGDLVAACLKAISTNRV